MGKIRRENYIFVTWIGDHSPKQVHVYRDRVLIVKWDLENGCPMKGSANAKIIQMINELKKEGHL